jgi:hypothetical protein
MSRDAGINHRLLVPILSHLLGVLHTSKERIQALGFDNIGWLFAEYSILAKCFIMV